MGLSETKKWAKSLVKKLAIAGAAGVVGYGFYLGAESNAVAEAKEKRLVDIFDEAGITQQKSQLVLHVISQQNGDCGLLNTDLAPRCEQVKAAIAAPAP